MVKLKGPGMATEASGSLAETLIFSKSKGVSYAKLHQKPKQPNTDKQLALRAIVNFLSKIWPNLPTADKATWTTLAAENNISNLNAAVGFNLDRWRGFHYPATKLPADEVLTTQTWNAWDLTGGIRHVRHFLQGNIANNGRAWAIHRGTAADFTRAWDNLVHLVPYLEGTFTYDWYEELPAGTYHYKGVRVSSDGRWQTEFVRGPILVPA